jgi:lipopolysaccharide assembly outer membrane protein LptD (OstA)
MILGNSITSLGAFFVLFITSVPTFSQVRDTTQIPPRDTIKTNPDTTEISTSGGVDTVIVYSAKDSVIYSIAKRTMSLRGKGSIRYQDLKLEADNIDIDWDSTALTAYGSPDTSDHTGKKFLGLPAFVEKNEKYRGSKVTYNFRNKKGRITVGETEIDNGFYYGSQIKRVSNDVFFIEGGRYTTCSNPDPHYYFGSPRMKVIPKEQIIAEPVYLYIADVPVFLIPFGVFPTKGGRQSGIIPPAYGDDARRGKNLRHFGYFWAMSDYTDLSATMDWFTKGGYVVNSLFRYNLRYNFNGTVSASYGEQKFDPDGSPQKDWSLTWRHDQEIDPTMRLNVNFSFLSNSFYQNTSNNFDEILRQHVVSTATLNKNWEGSNRSISVSMYRDQNLQTGEVDQQLPNITFSQAQFYPFRRNVKSRAAADMQSEQSWYETIGVNYGAQFMNSSRKYLQGPDSARYFTTDEQRGVSHTIGVNTSPKIGYFNITPYFNYYERWYDRRIGKTNYFTYDGRDSVVTDEKTGFSRVGYFNMGISASTRFYGSFRPNVFGIRGFRHTVTPTISYNFQPDFSKPGWGYYGSYTDAKGQEVRYSFFEKGIFGGAPMGQQQSINLNMGNLFEMKTATSDTAQQENKYQLLNFNAGLSYNFAADSLRLSELNLSYRTSIANLLDIGGGSSFNFYKYQDGIGRTNTFLVKETGQLAQLTNLSLNISASLRGEKTQAQKEQQVKVEEQPPKEAVPQSEKSGYYGLYGQEEAPDFNIPWNLTLSYDYSMSRPNPAQPFKSSNIRASLGFNLTEKWKITVNGYYDLINKELLAPTITIYRDLHCWELNFYWVPSGPSARFNVEIRIKAPQLQDVKITKQGSSRGVYQ